MARSSCGSDARQTHPGRPDATYWVRMVAMVMLFSGFGSPTDENAEEVTTLGPRFPEAVRVTVYVTLAPEANAGVLHRAVEVLADCAPLALLT